MSLASIFRWDGWSAESGSSAAVWVIRLSGCDAASCGVRVGAGSRAGGRAGSWGQGRGRRQSGARSTSLHSLVSRADFSGGSQLTLRCSPGRCSDGSRSPRGRPGGPSDLAVQASVVEPVDALRDGDLEVAVVLQGALLADQFGLEQRVDASDRALSQLSPVEPTETTVPASASRWV